MALTQLNRKQKYVEFTECLLMHTTFLFIGQQSWQNSFYRIPSNAALWKTKISINYALKLFNYRYNYLF